MSTTPPPLQVRPWALARRGWLQLVAAGAALVAVGAGLWRWRASDRGPSSVAELEAAMLTRWVDLLVPRDSSPGALDLGVHLNVLAAREANAGLAQACSQVLAELDRDARVRHGGEFLALPEAAQLQLLQALSDAGTQTLGGRVFLQLRQLTMQHHYSQAAAWDGLGLAHPPQPLGHMDYAQPPARRA